ncbi:hypothetical protein GCM10011578_079180 [Streptomyces fuscichromogenes]|uniref:Uncharacterized protein n=1 Tax=Streptomyces fuscichromogenes TaxID=1324013 RepID=A0A918CW47_9ACTN|nr:hypothetical protein GCM10011578_079180 [Streptomyces fuscichromogenes]
MEKKGAFWPWRVSSVSCPAKRDAVESVGPPEALAQLPVSYRVTRRKAVGRRTRSGEGAAVRCAVIKSFD